MRVRQRDPRVHPSNVGPLLLSPLVGQAGYVEAQRVSASGVPVLCPCATTAVAVDLLVPRGTLMHSHPTRSGVVPVL